MLNSEEKVLMSRTVRLNLKLKVEVSRNNSGGTIGRRRREKRSRKISTMHLL